MAVFASPLSALLLAWGRELGYRTVLVDPRVAERDAPTAPVTDEDPSPMVVAATPEAADPTTDVVVTDHHRDELVDMLDTALDTDARFIGLMGSARHEGPHVGPLRERGRTDADLDRIVRPIGFDIGSKTPAEIAVATLADLVARRNDRR
ncbi:XdhC family protein [Nitriliruptoria bacterium AS10]|nr:XdhC family protein [Salsipaludibacter albus]